MGAPVRVHDDEERPLVDGRRGVEAWQQHTAQHEKKEEGAKVLAHEEFEQESDQCGGRRKMQQDGHGQLRRPPLQALMYPTHRDKVTRRGQVPGPPDIGLLFKWLITRRS